MQSSASERSNVLLRAEREVHVGRKWQSYSRTYRSVPDAEMPAGVEKSWEAELEGPTYLYIRVPHLLPATPLPFTDVGCLRGVMAADREFTRRVPSWSLRGTALLN